MNICGRIVVVYRTTEVTFSMQHIYPYVSINQIIDNRIPAIIWGMYFVARKCIWEYRCLAATAVHHLLMTFSSAFLNKILLILNFTKVCSKGSNWQTVVIFTVDGLVPHVQQPITWTKDGSLHWRIYVAHKRHWSHRWYYASTGLNMLMGLPNFLGCTCRPVAPFTNMV